MERLNETTLEWLSRGRGQAIETACQVVESFLSSDRVVEAIFADIPDDWVCGAVEPTKLGFVAQYIYETLGVVQKG